jgi:hypothetical protein
MPPFKKLSIMVVCALDDKKLKVARRMPRSWYSFFIISL